MNAIRLIILAVTLIYSTEAHAPERIESITLYKIQEVRYKMAIDECEVKISMRKYITKQLAQWKRIKTAVTIVDAIYAAHKEFDLPIPLIMAIIEIESTWRPDVVSHKGARGLMQIMPVWDETLIKEGILETPEQIFDIARNIRAGCWILRHYLDDHMQAFVMEHRLMCALDDYSGGGGQEYIGKVRDAMKRIEE